MLFVRRFQRGALKVFIYPSESVYAQPVARDLLYILKACAAPRNASALKTAVAAPLLNLSLSELIQLQEDENTWERTVDTFIDFHEVWRSQGVCHATSFNASLSGAGNFVTG